MKRYVMEPPHEAVVEILPSEGEERPYGSRFLEPSPLARRHSPTGFSWGYHGSGPAALAASILADYLGQEVHPAVYQAFKADVVAAEPMDTAWSITEEQVAFWLRAYADRPGVTKTFAEPRSVTRG